MSLKLNILDCGSVTFWKWLIMCVSSLFSCWSVECVLGQRVQLDGSWMDYRSPARVQLNSDEPCCALVSVKHHLITGCVFIIIIVVVIIIIISLLPSLKSETMASP